MLNCKKLVFILFAIIIILPSCMEHKILFSFERDVNNNFFKEIPGLGAVTYLNQPVTKKANTIEIYVSSFREKYIEKDNLLEFSELNDSTKISYVPYWEVDGYSQDLYLLKYEFTYSLTNKNGKSFDIPAPACVFFAVKHNGKGDTIGITPCYFGSINTEDDVINFDTELKLKKEKNSYFLKPLKKNKKNNGLLFIPADFPESPGESSILNIQKIVRLDPNKVGGYKPIVFDISKIFHDTNALQFHYVSTVNLNP